MRFVTSALITSLFAASASQASVLQFDLDKPYTSSTHPAGSPAWVRVRADDNGANGSVKLSIDALNLTGSEFVSKVLLNIKAPIAPSSLSASGLNKAGTFSDPSVEFANNGFSAGGGSSFDMLVSFATGGPSNRFGAGDSVSFTVTGSSLLNAHTFNTFSSGGGSGPLFVSAHVQSIGGNGEGSAWITALAPTPEPASAVTLGAAFSLMARRRR